MVFMTEQEAEKIVSEILTRGVGEFIDPNNEFRKKLLAKAVGKYPKEIIIKFGVDPTRPDIHLGHAVVLRKLRQMQDIGCKVVFLVGDFTARIGDPTGKSKVRPEVEFHEIERNMQTYLEQIDKILSLSFDRESKMITESGTFSWIKNSEWYIALTDILVPTDAKPRIVVEKEVDGKKFKEEIPVDKDSFVGKAIYYGEQVLKQTTSRSKRAQVLQVSLRGILYTLRRITLAQLVERDMFAERIKKGEPLYMHEMLYPVLQGIDSTLIEKIYGACDLEVGGTDQTFNMLMGRTAMESEKQAPQAVLSFQLLVGLDGKEKMSKSLDNYIGITDEPGNMFGKIMSIPDALLGQYLELCTFTPMDEVRAIIKELESGKVNPKEVKMNLAQQIVDIYHGREAGVRVREQFVNTFQKKELPDDMKEVAVAKDTLLVDVLIKENLVSSKTDFRRLLDDGAIRVNGETKLTDPFMALTEGVILKIGKHRFLKIMIST